ncbi:hypothetical protein B0H14DRAFT_3479910 [Mycena olivaceomarginata]|nr:hypothetical protein B0H14DRAFT_3479910 [Mycena olivaceomarginata]
MQSSANTLLAERLLAFEYPALRWSIIALGRHFIVRSENQPLEHVLPIIHLGKLHIDVPNFVFHQSMTVLGHGRQEAVLTIINNVWTLVAVIIKALLVFHVNKTFTLE